jgi:outer membrane protein assembly factor BamA
MRAVHRSVVRPVLAAVLALVASPVLAQAPEEPSTRAGVIEKARDTLATESVTPQRSVIQRGLSWYDNQYLFAKLLGGWKGIHLAGGDFPAGAGLKLGIGYDKALTFTDSDPLTSNRVDLTARGAYSARGYARLSAGVNARNLGGSRVDVGVSGQYYEFPQEDFFGLGMDSLESNRTNYLLDAIETGVAVRWKPSRLELGGGVAFFRPRLGRGTDSLFPSTDDLFTAAAAPGLGSETDYLKGELSAALDWRDNPSHPHAGGRYAIAVTNFDDRDLGQYDFYRVDVNLQQYVPLPDRYRLVALRAEGVFTNADSDKSVPFYLQPTLGGASRLRGFRESRFRDQNSVLVGAEYRWEAWWALDAALFVDAGMVAPSRRTLSLRDTEVGYGIGFRFHSNRAFVGRFDLAFSREGFVPLLRFEHVF